MGTKKIILLIIVICSLLSCDNTAKNQEILRLNQENSDLKICLDRTKDEKSDAIKRDLEQSKIFDDALMELSEISQSSNKIRISLETGTFDYLTQTEILSRQIESIKFRLDSLKIKNSDLVNRISSLESLVEIKNSEIRQLIVEIKKIKIENENQTAVIIDQGGRIGEMIKEIEKEKNKFKQLYFENLKNSAEIWFQMGENLLKILNNLPDVSGIKDKKKINDLKLQIEVYAKKCYAEAYYFDHPQAYSKYIKLK